MAYELATPAIQAALIARLEADAALAALLKTRPAARGGGPAIYEDGDVYDGQTMPYLTIGLWTQTADHLFSNWGWTCTCQIKAISQTISRPPQVTSAVLTALEHGTRLDLPGYDAAWIDEINAQPMFRAQQAGKSTFELPIIVRVNVSEATAPPVVPASPLLESLVSYWSFDVGWNDLHGTNHLTNTTGVTAVPGKLGNAADFERSSAQYLSCPMTLGDQDFTYAFWIKQESPDDFIDEMILAGLNYAMSFDALDNIQFYFGDSTVALVQGPRLNNTNWHFIVAGHDATANTMFIQADNGAVTSAPTSGVAPSGAGTFFLGTRTSLGIYFDGLIDEVGLWHRVLTADERTQLYNSGTGLAYPFDE